MYAIGANPGSARLTGINLEGQVAKAFVLMAFAVFLAMITSVSMVGMASPTSGERLEFLALTAVILGGVGLAGGRGTVIGTLVAVLILAVVDNALVLSGVQAFWQEVARGSLLLLAVIFDQVSRKRDKSVRMEI
jgi:ribose transport system permease protein